MGNSDRSAQTAYIATGANLGDRAANIRSALDQLGQTPGVEVVRTSSLMENPAVGMGDDAPPFLNGAAELRTTLGARALLHRLLEIERGMGRSRGDGWKPRPIDLDLLFFGDQVHSSDELVVPHPMLHERLFVLQPLAELAPDFVHPTLQMTVAGLLDNLRRPAAADE